MGNADKFIVGGKTYEVVSPSTFGEYTETIGGACINPNGLAQNAIFLGYKDNVQNLYKATSAIAYGASIVENTNCVQTTLKQLLATTSGGAIDISYNNSESGLEADNVQAAIDELAEGGGGGGSSTLAGLSDVSLTSLANGQGITYDSSASKWKNTTLAAVATSGAYSDLTGKPTLATVATSGDYDDLLDKPTLAAVATSGAYSDLSGTPTLAAVATSGDYDDLLDKPTLATVATSGSYSDLSNKPTLGTAAAKDSTNAVTQSSTDLVESGAVYTEINTLTTNQGNLADLTTSAKNNLVAAINEAAQSGGGGGGGSSTLAGLSDVSISGLSDGQGLTYDSTSTKWKNHTFAAVATSGAYSDLSGKPTLAAVATSGAYSDLSGTPTLATVATSGDYDDLLDKPSLAAVATSGAYSDLSGTPTLATVATSGSYSDLSNKPTLGTAAAKSSTNAVTQGSTDLVESGAVYTETSALNSALSNKQDSTLASAVTIGGTSRTTVEGALGALADSAYLENGLTSSSTTKALTAAQGLALANKHKVSSFEVSTSSWTQDTTSQSGTTLQKKTIALSHCYVDSPSVDIGAASGSVLPTTAQQTAYNLLQYVTVDSAIPCLYLYASDVPTDAFYINVEGVD